MNKIHLSNDQVLLTKLYIPQKSAALVSRDQLLERMNRTLRCKLTIVSAPPGFGKSTLLSDWVQRNNVPAGWVSLDRGENDLSRFWTYVVRALQTIEASAGVQALSLLQSPQKLVIENVLTLLLNDLVMVPFHFVLVLDDCHLIESREVHSSLSFLLERLPAQMHLVLASRTDIPLPLGNLRAKDQLHEIGIADIRFSTQEIVSYWQQQLGNAPEDAELQLLEERTEGWIVGLQLAALIRKDQSGLAHPIQTFSGEHRFVVEYLMEEVFLRLPEDKRQFLQQTSILERMNRSLCAAVTSMNDEENPLGWLEKSNLFLIALDGERYWYRYHHLFADFLQNRLKREVPEQITALHQKASLWFEQHQYWSESIDHAILAEDFERAALLIEEHATAFLKARQFTSLIHWMDQLPVQISRRPGLFVIRMWMQLLYGDVTALTESIAYIEQVIESGETNYSPNLLWKVREEVKCLSQFSALFRGDFETVYKLLKELAERDDFQENRDVFLISGIELNYGDASLVNGFLGFSGKLKQALRYHQLYLHFIERNHLQEGYFSGNVYTALS